MRKNPMANSMDGFEIKIDDYDQAIIRLLMIDGRMSIADISRHVSGLSERAIDYRINRLLDSGVITINNIINPAGVGYPLRADMLINVRGGTIRSVADRLVALERASYVAVTLGRHDIALSIHARDNNDLQNYLQENLATIPEVTATKTMLVARILKYLADWHIPATGENVLAYDHPMGRQTASQGMIEVTDLDEEIFDCLHLNSRMPITEMVRRITQEGLKATANKVSSRLSDLIQNRTIYVAAIVNPEAVGYPLRADAIIEVEGNYLQKVAEKLVLMQETSYVTTPVDGNKIGIQLFMPNTTALYNLIVDKIQQFPGVIKTETTLIPDVLLDINDWRVPKGTS
jgi:DNA-binding Lrp family transcriptional regulator